MNCIYLRFRRRTKGWSIRRIGRARFSRRFTSRAEEKLVRKLKKLDHERKEVLNEIEKLLEEEEKRYRHEKGCDGRESIPMKKMKRFRRSRERSAFSNTREIARLLRGEKMSSDEDEQASCFKTTTEYTTTEHIQRLFRVRDESTSSEDAPRFKVTSGYATTKSIQGLFRAEKEKSSSDEVEEAPRFKANTESTTKDIQKEFREDDETTTTGKVEEVTLPKMDFGYRRMPYVFGKASYQRSIYASENEDQPCSSQQAAERDRRRHSRMEVNESKEVEKESASFCKNYESVSLFIPRKTKKKSRRNEFRDLLKKYEFMETINPTPPPKYREYMNERIARGRDRLRELRNREDDSREYNEFATFSEVLQERGLPGNAVICCPLCRLLISPSLREEFFASVCDCPEKFVHSKCALLHLYEFVRQECRKCGKSKQCKLLNRSRSPSPSRIEEYELHQLSKETSGYVPVYRKRLLEHFDHHCFICRDKRRPQKGKFEKIEATILRACICRVTAHNACLVDNLSESSVCKYCNYRFKFKMTGPYIGCCDRRVVSISVSRIGATYICAALILYIINTTELFSDRNADKICKSVVTVLAYLTAALMTIYTIRQWRMFARSYNRNTHVVMKPYRPPKPIKEREIEITEQWEEVPFTERSIGAFLKLYQESEVENGNESNETI